MKVILTQDVKGSGKKGDVIEVSDGYAKNFLFNKKMAVPADAAALNDLKQKKSSMEHKEEVARAEANENKSKIDGKAVVIKAKAGGDGARLFGSITAKDIAEAVKATYGIEVDKKKITLKNDIKNFGTYTAEVKFMAGAVASLTVNVEKE